MSKMSLFEAMVNRRSIYGIGKRKSIPAERVTEIVRHAIKHVPSPFNSQSARVIVLFEKESDKFWTMVKNALEKIVPAGQFDKTAEKIDSFNSGWGTILFFEDSAVISKLMSDYSLYADNFPVWSNQSNGMLQYAIWTGLESEGLGASLQHYAPLVEGDVQREWKVDSNWKLLAQMPFGSVEVPAGEKTFLPLEERLRIFS